MKRFALSVVLCFGCAASTLLAQGAPAEQAQGKFEVGAFADYLRVTRPVPPLDMLGFGLRAGVHVSRNLLFEAEMSYDFRKSLSSSFTNGFSTQVVTTRVRTINALFGPKYNVKVWPIQGFVTIKGGFVNFSSDVLNASQGFTSALGSVTSGDTRPAFYPAVGLEKFLGPIGLRVELGDDIYFDHGMRQNLRATFGPQFRF
ncbi:MAG: hypothetical protein DMG68_17515 [Acidobacteria bacterium]|jgi:hypothetical protein|nr:MAG: hypothetical protein DMG68_17515 [Acidobacteriota bacterium]